MSEQIKAAIEAGYAQVAGLDKRMFTIPYGEKYKDKIVEWAWRCQTERNWHPTFAHTKAKTTITLTKMFDIPPEDYKPEPPIMAKGQEYVVRPESR